MLYSPVLGATYSDKRFDAAGLGSSHAQRRGAEPGRVDLF